MSIGLAFITSESDLPNIIRKASEHNGFIEHQSPVSPNGMVALQLSFNSDEDIEKFVRSNAGIKVF